MGRSGRGSPALSRYAGLSGVAAGLLVLLARFDPGVRAVPLAHVGGIVCAVIAFLAARRRPGHRPA